MGGEIGFNSVPDSGSQFWFHLDFEHGVESRPKGKGVAENDDLRGVSKHILVAEDNPINRKVIARILESAGHRVDLVEDGEEALVALRRFAYDLAIMDLQIPQMGGLQAMRQYLSDGDDIPFVVLTANATTQALQECTDAGVRACLTKPVEARHLLAVVADLSRAKAIG